MVAEAPSIGVGCPFVFIFALERSGLGLQR